MIESELYAHLRDNTPSLGGRIYPKMMPESCELPAAIYGVVSDGDIETLGCVIGSSTRFQVDIYSTSYTQSKALKDELKQALYSFNYKPQELYSNDSYEDDTKLYREMIDFKIQS